jgi:FdhD protein
LKRYQQSFRPEQIKTDGVMPWRIQRLTEEGASAVEAGVVVEEPLEIRLDGQPVVVLMRTPGMEKELAAGFCLGEGLVASPNDIALVRHCGRAQPNADPSTAENDPLDESRNQVDVICLPGTQHPEDPIDAVQLIRSGCGRAEVTTLVKNLGAVNGQVQLHRETISCLLGDITRQQAAYRAAGGIHAAAIFGSTGRLITLCEDIGRHNAVDKATGYCLLRGIPLQDKMLISTGRASYDMVAKGVRLGVPIIASISSPTSLAVELAESLNCTLLGYVRGKALNIYTHGWRIIGHGDRDGTQTNNAGAQAGDNGSHARSGRIERRSSDITTTGEV